MKNMTNKEEMLERIRGRNFSAGPGNAIAYGLAMVADAITDAVSNSASQTKMSDALVGRVKDKQ